MKPTRITARISAETHTLLRAAAKRTNTTASRLVEEALVHHLDALRALPDDASIPPRIVLDAISGRRVAERLLHPRAPTAAMRALMGEES